MFTRKEKNMLFDPYFEVIRETEQFIEVRSVNTGHCVLILENTPAMACVDRANLNKLLRFSYHLKIRVK